MIALWIILGILLIIGLILTGLLFLKTKVIVSYKNDKFNIVFRNGLIKYTYKPKEKPQKEEKDVTRESIERDIDDKKSRLTDKTSFLWILLCEMRFKVEVLKTEIKIDYGTDDPADTGILYGIIWAAIGNLYQIFNHYLVFDFPNVEINPDFENQLFEIEFYGIIKIRLVHIINALIKNRKGKR